jgi:hypothetical protein
MRSWEDRSQLSTGMGCMDVRVALMWGEESRASANAILLCVFGTVLVAWIGGKMLVFSFAMVKQWLSRTPCMSLSTTDQLIIDITIIPTWWLDRVSSGNLPRLHLIPALLPPRKQEHVQCMTQTQQGLAVTTHTHRPKPLGFTFELDT